MPDNLERLSYTPNNVFDTAAAKNHALFLESDFIPLKASVRELYKKFSAEAARKLIDRVRSTIVAVTAKNSSVVSDSNDLSYANRRNVVKVANPDHQDLYLQRKRMLKLLQIEVILLNANKTGGWQDSTFLTEELPKLEKYLRQNAIDREAGRLLQELELTKRFNAVETEVYTDFQIRWTRHYEGKLLSIIQTNRIDSLEKYFKTRALLDEIQSSGIKLEKRFLLRLLEIHKNYEVVFLEKNEKRKEEVEKIMIAFLENNETSVDLSEDDLKFFDYDLRKTFINLLSVIETLEKVETPDNIKYNLKYFNTSSHHYEKYILLIYTLNENKNLQTPNPWIIKIKEKMDKLNITGRMKTIYHRKRQKNPET